MLIGESHRICRPSGATAPRRGNRLVRRSPSRAKLFADARAYALPIRGRRPPHSASPRRLKDSCGRPNPLWRAVRRATQLILCSEPAGLGTRPCPWTEPREHKPRNPNDRMSSTAFGLARTGLGPGSDLRKRLPLSSKRYRSRRKRSRAPGEGRSQPNSFQVFSVTPRRDPGKAFVPCSHAHYRIFAKGFA